MKVVPNVEALEKAIADAYDNQRELVIEWLYDALPEAPLTADVAAAATRLRFAYREARDLNIVLTFLAAATWREQQLRKAVRLDTACVWCRDGYEVAWRNMGDIVGKYHLTSGDEGWWHGTDNYNARCTTQHIAAALAATPPSGLTVVDGDVKEPTAIEAMTYAWREHCGVTGRSDASWPADERVATYLLASLEAQGYTIAKAKELAELRALRERAMHVATALDPDEKRCAEHILHGEATNDR